jgi:long-chain acyl-CoA synthetase
MNIYSVLQDAAKRFAPSPAILDRQQSFSCQELYETAEKVAAELSAAGIRAGDKIALLFPNNAAYVVAFFAVLRARAIVVPVSPALSAEEVESVAEELGISAFCYDANFESIIPRRADSRRSTIIGARCCVGRRTRPSIERERLQSVNAAIIRFTSGTTSAAKGIVVSHDTLARRMHAQRGDIPLERGEAILCMQPLTMVFAAPLYVFLSAGCPLILAGAMDMEGLSSALRAHRVAQIHALPVTFRLMIDDDAIATSDLRDVKYLVSTSSALPNPTAEAFRGRFGREVLQHYGFGEGARGMANWSEDPGKRGSVGLPAAGYECKLDGVSSERNGGAALGELLLRGPCLFEGYYKPWRPRDEVLEDGWFRTGDIARRDADGYYWIVGRTKEVINVGGMKVFPQELEDILLQHPAVEEALVYGAPAARFGEAPRAKVKLRRGMKATEKEILEFANAKLSVFRMLRGVELVDEIAKTPTGKPRRWTPAE